MAKIVQVLTRASKEYDVTVAESQVRDLDAIVEKLNTTFCWSTIYVCICTSWNTLWTCWKECMCGS